MSALIYLIPAALFLGLLGLIAFMWALRSGQFEDLDGAAHRILHDEQDDAPRGRAVGDCPPGGTGCPGWCVSPRRGPASRRR